MLFDVLIDVSWGVFSEKFFHNLESKQWLVRLQPHVMIILYDYFYKHKVVEIRNLKKSKKMKS